MELKRLAIRVTETYGLLHAMMIAELRRYIKETLEERLVDEIAEIKDAALLRALWEAGLSSRLQSAVLEQLKKIS